MPHLQTLILGSVFPMAEKNNITSMEVIRRAAWPDIQRLDLSKHITYAENNHFRDAQRLVEGYFPQI